MSLLPLLLLAGAPVYLVGTEVNLRKKPSRKAKIVAKLPIKQRCEALGEQRGWVKLRCGAHVGFTKPALTSTTKPTAAAMDRAAEAAKTVKERLTFRMRAAVLIATEDRLATLRAAWLDAEHAILKRSKKVIARRPCRSVDCLDEAFALLRGNQDLLDRRGDAFVYATLTRDGLSVVLGRVAGGELRVHLSNGYKPEAALLQALRAVATPREPSEEDLLPASRVPSERARAWAASQGTTGWADPDEWRYCPPDGDAPVWRFQARGLFVQGVEVRYGDGNDMRGLVDLRLRRGKPVLEGRKLVPADSLTDPCRQAEEECARWKTAKACEEKGDAVCYWVDGSCEFSAP